MKRKDGKSLSVPVVSLGVLVFVTFLTSLYLKGLNSGIPLYYDSLGQSATVGGTFVAVFTLASTVMRLVGGQITDHFSHYRVLKISLLGLLIGAVIPIFSDGFYVVVISRILQGASFALSANVMTVAVMGSASKKHLGKRVGIKSMGTSLGTMFGALVATFLLDDVGYAGFYGFFALTIVVSIIAIALLKRYEIVQSAHTSQYDAAAGGTASSEENTVGGNTADGADEASSNVSNATAENTEKGSVEYVPAKTADKVRAGALSAATTSESAKVKNGLNDLVAPYLYPQVAPFLAVAFSWKMMRGFCIAFILIYARSAHIGSGAMFFVLAGAVTLACGAFGGKLFDSNRSSLLFPLMCVEVLGFALLVLFPTFEMLMLAAVCYGISIGLSSPFVKALAAKSAPQEHWGVVNGELFFFGDIGKAIGAFCGGLIIDAAGKAFIPEIALGFAIFAALVTGLAVLVKARMHSR